MTIFLFEYFGVQKDRRLKYFYHFNCKNCIFLHVCVCVCKCVLSDAVLMPRIQHTCQSCCSPSTLCIPGLSAGWQAWHQAPLPADPLVGLILVISLIEAGELAVLLCVRPRGHASIHLILTSGFCRSLGSQQFPLLPHVSHCVLSLRTVLGS